MLRWRSRVSCRSPEVQAEAPARAPGALPQDNLQTHKRPDQNHRCRRAKAATWDATKYLRCGETTFRSVTYFDWFGRFGLLNLSSVFNLVRAELHSRFASRLSQSL